MPKYSYVCHLEEAPRSALSFPEPPPSPQAVTIAVILLVYNLSPLNIVDKPVPPPITTILGPPT